MDSLAVNMVQAQIGYTFKNLDLLEQAFTRRTYSQEKGGENNEVLEFIGDKVLDLAAVHLLTCKYGRMRHGGPLEVRKSSGAVEVPLRGQTPDTPNEFLCSLDEGELTDIKSRMVRKKYLSRRIDEMGFAPYLKMGKGEMGQGGSSRSAKEDLFEAILGAAALDSGWDMAVLFSIVDAMLVPEDFLAEDYDDNYVRIIYEWEAKRNHVLPWFWFQDTSAQSVIFDGFHGISQPLPWEAQEAFQIHYACEMKLLNGLPIFRGFGPSKSEARQNVCKLAYEYLRREGYIRKSGIRNEIGEPTKEFAINQLEILARRGNFTLPEYDYAQEYDPDGNPIWHCTCKIREYAFTFRETASSKKKAKKSAALKMLQAVLSEEDP